MQNIGDRVKAREVGFAGRGFVYWHECPKCHTGRWVRKESITTHPLCVKCGNQGKAEYHETLPNGDAVVIGVNARKSTNPESRSVLYLSNCPTCGTELWRQYQSWGKRCGKCAQKAVKKDGEDSPTWKGGRFNVNGYIVVKLSRKDPFFAMADARNRRVFEHRYVMAKHLGRCLEDWEVVHHKDGNRSHNSIGNLELLPNNAQNVAFDLMGREIAKLREQVKLLQWRVTELESQPAHGNAVRNGSNESSA